MSEVTKLRHVAKTISYRIVGSSATFSIAYIMTGSFSVAGVIGITQIVLNTFLYYVHERVWYKYIKFGLKGKEHEKISY
jgi:uncharacterized membrane protein